MIFCKIWHHCMETTGISPAMRPANQRCCYNVTKSLIVRAHTQTDPCTIENQSQQFYQCNMRQLHMLYPVAGELQSSKLCCHNLKDWPWCHVTQVRQSTGDGLTHWGRDKMDAIFQTTFSNGFSWMKMYELRLTFHWSLFLGVQLTIFQHWFR